MYRPGVLRTTKAWRQRKERYRLIGSKCLACGTIWWPSRRVCGKCTSRNVEDLQLSSVGKLLIHHAGQLPWHVAPLGGFEVFGDTRVMTVVELPEGVYVGPTDLVDCPPEKIRDGMLVRRVLRKLRREGNGNWQYGYMWVPEEPQP
jgi:uncharacterized OB-fold protein